MMLTDLILPFLAEPPPTIGRKAISNFNTVKIVKFVMGGGHP